MRREREALGEALRAVNQVKDQEAAKTLVGDLDSDEWVNLTLRVKKRDRMHWVSSAKREGVAVVNVVQQALIDRFGSTPLLK